MREAAKIYNESQRERYGFLTDTELPILAQDEVYRTIRVLVRCGGSRFIACAQDALVLIEAVEASGKEYVRDVSIYKDR